jgi:hypothetical protein
MKTVILTTLIASAAAFAPVSQETSSSALHAKAKTAKVPSVFANELGAQMPLGYFDPMGICADGNTEAFERLRFVEVKHGRVAMLAVVGYLVTFAGIRFPGAENIPSGFAALPAIPAMVWVQMAFTWGMMEALNRDAFGLAEFPGDFRNGALDFGWDKLDEKTKLRKRAVELNQGRAAQMGILGIMVHDNLGNLESIGLAH